MSTNDLFSKVDWNSNLDCLSLRGVRPRLLPLPIAGVLPIFVVIHRVLIVKVFG